MTPLSTAAKLAESRFVSAFAVAMATMEGFYTKGNPAERNRNPGNIRPWRGCTFQSDNNLIVFPTGARGWGQLHRQIRKNISRGLTTYEFFARQRDKDGKDIKWG